MHNHKAALSTHPIPARPRTARTALLILGVWAVCVAVTASGCRRKSSPHDAGPDVPTPPAQAAAVATPPVAPPCRTAPGSFAEIGARMAPNLVTILVTTREGPGPEAALPLFVSPAAPTTTVARPELESLGTGFFLDTGETLVSSYHVVGEIPHMTVRLADGSLVQATLRGTSLDADLAVFRVDRPPHGAVQLVDSARLRPGDWLALLADPFGSGVSVTAGVVRFLPAPEDARAPRAFSRFIGADLTVDAANQGGMVTDAGGRLVGLAASTTTAGSRVGLVLPVADLRQEIARLDGPDRASRSWIGLWVRVLVADDARDLGLDPPRGLLVTRIVPGGPADDAGILPRDAVLEFSGEPVTTPAAFAALASRADVSQAIPVVIWRDGRPRTVRLRPAPMPQ